MPGAFFLGRAANAVRRSATNTGAPALAGSGALVAASIPKVARPAAVSGSGALGATGTAGATALAVETFTGTNGAAWPSKWTSFFGGTSSAAPTIQSNAGQLVSSADAYSIGVISYLNAVTTADFNLVIDVTFTTLDEQYLQIGGRRSLPSSANLAYAGWPGYYVAIYPGNGANSCGVNKTVSGTQTALSGDLAAGAWVAGVARRMRFQAVGSTLSLRFWDPAASEPGTWLWTGTDTDFTSGYVGISYAPGSAGTVETALVDNITLTATGS